MMKKVYIIKILKEALAPVNSSKSKSTSEIDLNPADNWIGNLPGGWRREQFESQGFLDIPCPNLKNKTSRQFFEEIDARLVKKNISLDQIRALNKYHKMGVNTETPEGEKSRVKLLDISFPVMIEFLKEGYSAWGITA
jgi:hypothetical protein